MPSSVKLTKPTKLQEVPFTSPNKIISMEKIF
jgi:hypothetical protein